MYRLSAWSPHQLPSVVRLYFTPLGSATTSIISPVNNTVIATTNVHVTVNRPSTAQQYTVRQPVQSATTIISGQ
jgi:hypothetical protein